MSRPDGTPEENSPDSEEGQPGGVSAHLIESVVKMVLNIQFIILYSL